MHLSDEKFAFVEHLVTEHRRLDQLLRQAAAVLEAAGEAEDCLPRLTSTVAAIRCELAQHFSAEQQGGCLEEAAARCPAVSPDVRRLVTEQDELLERLDEMVVRCQTTIEPGGGKVIAIEQELRLMIRELHRHETQESRIVERGFGVNLCDDEPLARESPTGATRL
jgi:iron-sulfur cluster repair protein YtfE (RIC family)